MMVRELMAMALQQGKVAQSDRSQVQSPPVTLFGPPVTDFPSPPVTHLSGPPVTLFWVNFGRVLLVKSPGHKNLYLPLGALVFEARARQKKL